ncbi:MAG: hypothetical protein QM723_31875 [Myxococcaceae bacterium]
MRATVLLVCGLLLSFGSKAWAAAPSAAGDVPRAALGAAPSSLHLLPGAAEGEVPVPTGDPVRDSKGALFLAGLGLTAAGLILGGAGFAVLWFCGEGSSCHSENTTIIGWALAAPGILPLVAGIIILYITLDGGRRGGRLAELLPGGDDWAITMAPMPGGGAAAMGLWRF